MSVITLFENKNEKRNRFFQGRCLPMGILLYAVCFVCLVHGVVAWCRQVLL